MLSVGFGIWLCLAEAHGHEEGELGAGRGRSIIDLGYADPSSDLSTCCLPTVLVSWAWPWTSCLTMNALGVLTLHLRTIA